MRRDILAGRRVAVRAVMLPAVPGIECVSSLRRAFMTRVTCHPAVCWVLQDENILCDTSSTTFWLADFGISRLMNRSRCIALEDIPCALLLQPVLHEACCAVACAHSALLPCLAWHRTRLPGPCCWGS